MAETIRSKAAILALYADNGSGDISPQDGRDFITSAIPSGRGPTFQVAATGATQARKTSSDYECDGTADNVQIQAAIDALPAAGGKVMLTEGTFTIASQVVLPSDTVLQGQGSTSILKLRDSHGSGVDILDVAASASDVQILDLQVDGNKANNAGQTAHAIKVNAGASNIKIDNCSLVNCTGNGVRAKTGTGAVITNLVISHSYVNATDEHGIVFNWEVEKSSIYKCWIGNTAANANGIWVGNSSTHLNIEGNTIDTPGDIGIELWTGCDFSTVRGNVVKDAGLMGISLDGSDWCTVVGNVVDTPSGQGLELALSQRCVLEGNTVFNPGATGIAVSNTTPKENIIKNNQVIDGGSSVHGIQIVNTGTGSQITGNVVINCNRGIFINGAGNNIKIAENYVRDNDATGIYLFNVTDPEIYNNTMINNNVGAGGGEVDGVFLNTVTTPKVYRNVGNSGHFTGNTGTGSITSGGTTDVITHGLAITPTAANIIITLTENPTNTPGAIWVDTIGSSQFTVNCENDPSTSNLDFAWQVLET